MPTLISKKPKIRRISFRKGPFLKKIYPNLTPKNKALLKFAEYSEKLDKRKIDPAKQKVLEEKYWKALQKKYKLKN